VHFSTGVYSWAMTYRKCRIVAAIGTLLRNEMGYKSIKEFIRKKEELLLAGI
jgi:hypothetical protein